MIEFDYNAHGINGEPEHDTGSVWCWCAPVIDGDVVTHRTLADVIAADNARLAAENAKLREEVERYKDEYGEMEKVVADYQGYENEIVALTGAISLHSYVKQLKTLSEGSAERCAAFHS